MNASAQPLKPDAPPAPAPEAPAQAAEKRPAAALVSAPGLAPRQRQRSLSVGVIVDLIWGPWAGGHVKCWERLAAAATQCPADVDVTVHFLGEQSGTVQLADNARFKLHRPIVNTKWLGFTQNPQNHTCLAPFHMGLAHDLAGHDIVHATGAFFSLAKTALRHTRKRGVPLTYSFHTDTVSYTRHFSKEILKRWFGDGAILRFLVDTVRYNEISGDRMQAVQDAYLRQCDWVLASKPDDRAVAERVVPAERISFLRRGLDREVFTPKRRDKARLSAAYGVGEDRFVVIFAGRIDDAKNVMTLAEAVRRLLARDMPVHLLLAGTGERTGDIRRMLGNAVTCCGQVEPDVLGWLYASADVFAFPSELEILPNVVNEARACFLPALVAASSGAAQLIGRPGIDALCLPGSDTEAWTDAIARLMADDARRRALADSGYRHVMATLPGWDDVLRQDLLPVWRRVIDERRARAPAPA
jgi:glycosyltransferase involved in cell wall biosynthesis